MRLGPKSRQIQGPAKQVDPGPAPGDLERFRTHSRRKGRQPRVDFAPAAFPQFLRRYGIRASAPTFIPGFGALVRLKQMPASPRENARIGLSWFAAK